MLKLVKRNPINIAFVVAIGGCLIISNGNLQQQFNAIGQVRQSTLFNTTKDMELRASQQATQMNAQIAQQRYQAGCLKLQGALVQGKPVFQNGSPLPKGTIVCDRFGNTGKLVPRDFDKDGKYVPVVAETAFTGNSKVVKSVFGGR